jgi:hypothetical protein
MKDVNPRKQRKKPESRTLSAINWETIMPELLMAAKKFGSRAAKQ